MLLEDTVRNGWEMFWLGCEFRMIVQKIFQMKTHASLEPKESHTGAAQLWQFSHCLPFRLAGVSHSLHSRLPANSALPVNILVNPVPVWLLCLLLLSPYWVLRHPLSYTTTLKLLTTYQYVSLHIYSQQSSLGFHIPLGIVLLQGNKEIFLRQTEFWLYPSVMQPQAS